MRKPRASRRKKPEDAPASVIEGSDAVLAPVALVEEKVALKAPVKADPFLDEIYTKKMVDTALDHKKFVGPQDKFDEMGEHQFDVMKQVGVKKTSDVLDIGCGSMRGGKFLLDYLGAGKYHGIEPNEPLLKKGLFAEVDEALVREKTPKFRFNDNFELAVFGKEFDFVLAQAIFAHAAPQQIETCLRSAHEALVSGGKFIFSYLQGDASHKGSTWVYPNCTKYTEPDMLEYVTEAGFTIEENDFEHPVGLSWIVAKKQ